MHRQKSRCRSVASINWLRSLKSLQVLDLCWFVPVKKLALLSPCRFNKLQTKPMIILLSECCKFLALICKWKKQMFQHETGLRSQFSGILSIKGWRLLHTSPEKCKSNSNSAVVFLKNSGKNLIAFTSPTASSPMSCVCCIKIEKSLPGIQYTQWLQSLM